VAVSADAICDLDLKGVSEAIAAGKVSSLEATEAYLRRIEKYDGALQSYITVMADEARARAAAADRAGQRRERRGPLQGVPIALKDLIAVAGVRMTAGSRVLADHVPDTDAFVTARLHEAGAVILGKLSLHEFAFGRPATDGPFPTGRNPWDVRRAPAGSSSGSAVAVAAGLCAGALGSDTGGSIRGPASMVGIVGHKPTYGLVSRRGAVPMDWSLDHIGPMTRSVWDSAVMLGTIAGEDAGDTSTRGARVQDYTRSLEAGVKGMRLGLLRRYYLDWPGLHDDVRAAALTAFDELKRQGASVEDVHASTLDLAMAAWVAFLAEMYEYHAATLRARSQDYGESLRPRIYMGALVTASDYLRAQRVRARLLREVKALLEKVDALIFPGQASPAVSFEDVPMTGVMPASGRFTAPWNLLGLPAIVVPCGISADGMPVSIQIVGRAFDDATVLRVARAYERATDWHTRRPPPARWTA
jgi:aspartyl-tRNA(Asn)/glutamyl-tRNA(Gln) amidotransferase subunit A